MRCMCGYEGSEEDFPFVMLGMPRVCASCLLTIVGEKPIVAAQGEGGSCDIDNVLNDVQMELDISGEIEYSSLRKEEKNDQHLS